jgi:hypothetical protein
MLSHLAFGDPDRLAIVADGLLLAAPLFLLFDLDVIALGPGSAFAFALGNRRHARGGKSPAGDPFDRSAPGLSVDKPGDEIIELLIVHGPLPCLKHEGVDTPKNRTTRRTNAIVS